MKTARITIYLVVILGMALSAQAKNFTLTGNHHLDIIEYYINGYLYDFSTANVNLYKRVDKVKTYNGSTLNVSGGKVGVLKAYNDSTVNVSGGGVGVLKAYNDSIANISSGRLNSLEAGDNVTVNVYGEGSVVVIDALNSSTVNISGGYLENINAYDRSTVNISGGSNSWLDASGNATINISGGDIVSFFAVENSIVNISGGSFDAIVTDDSSIMNISGGNISQFLRVTGDSTVIFDGYDFILGEGLSWDIDSQIILGTGILTGKWFDDTSFVIPILDNASTATIMAIPEPTTVALLGLGVVGVLRKRR